MSRDNDFADDDNPYRYTPTTAESNRSLDRRSSPPDQVAFDDSDWRWGWVRTGLLLLLFGYFCVPFFIGGLLAAQHYEDLELIRGTLIVGTTCTLIPIAIGWFLCALTPAAVGTGRFALLAAIGTLLQVWIGLARVWPDIIPLPAKLIRRRTLISIVTLGMMLRYIQNTFEYLKPGHSDTWVLALRKVTSWVFVVAVVAICTMLFLPANIRALVLIPLLTVIGIGALAIFILFWGSLFRLWFLLRGEGQFAINDRFG